MRIQYKFLKKFLLEGTSEELALVDLIFFYAKPTKLSYDSFEQYVLGYIIPTTDLNSILILVPVILIFQSHVSVTVYFLEYRPNHTFPINIFALVKFFQANFCWLVKNTILMMHSLLY